MSASNSPIKQVGLLSGLIVFAALVLSPDPSAMPREAWAVTALALLMAIWWITEALPLAATAVCPLVLLPVLGVTPIEKVAPAYADPLIFLFLGGFLIARTMERWQLHNFVALLIIRVGGSGAHALIASLMVGTAFLSMWISNTAAALVMLPIGLSIIAERRSGVGDANPEDDQFAPALMLGIAFSATIGGMASLIGTPPNALFAAFLKSNYGIEIGFARWMLIGIPIALLLLPLAWLVLTRLAFRIPKEDLPRSDRTGFSEINVQSLSYPARKAALIILIAALALILRPLMETMMPGLLINDAGILLSAALVLFALPARWSESTRLLSWEDAKTIRWDVLILFGGGLALASAIDDSGLSQWVGSSFAMLNYLPIALIVLLAMAVVVYLGELASNTAMAAVFLPIAAATAISLGQEPLTLVLPVALAASLGFMLPVATPPNAIIYGSGEVSNVQMIRAGAILDVGAILIVYAVAMLLGPLVIHS